MKMNKVVYYLKKLLIFLVSILALSILVFFISRMTPTDPLQSYYGERTEKMSVEEKDRARERLGLNDPVCYPVWQMGAECFSRRVRYLI